jgi:hypothetical protein
MRAFLLIVIAGLGSAVLGGGFGWLVGSLSPDFIALLAQPYLVAQPERLGAALGLVSGLFLGAVAMAFGLLVDAFRLWALRGKASREVPPRQALHPNSHAEEHASISDAEPVVDTIRKSPCEL